jgi:hypothetical protein
MLVLTVATSFGKFGAKINCNCRAGFSRRRSEMTFALFADSDKIATSDSRSELRGYLRNADFRVWAKESGYTELTICVDSEACSVPGDHINI